MKTYSIFVINKGDRKSLHPIMGSIHCINDAVEKTIEKINRFGFSEHFRNNPEFKFLVEEYEQDEESRELFTVTIKIEKA